MGQHKTNPTAIKAKNGEYLPPKKKPMSKRESERLLRQKCRDIVYGSLHKAYNNMQKDEFN